jgi:hypothetical protein
MFGSANENPRPPFEISPLEQKMWEDWAQASTAPNSHQALQDWARRYKLKLTNQTVMTVKMRGAGGQLSPPVLELASVILERHTVNGALLPIEEELEPGEPMEAQACQSNCADAFETGQTTKSV